MKLTNEEKARIFAMYLGAEVKRSLGGISKLEGVIRHDDSEGLEWFIRTDQCKKSSLGIMGNYKLILTPLSEITDADCIEVAKMICGQQYVDIQNIKSSYDDTLRGSHILKITFEAYQVTRFSTDTPQKHTVHITEWGVINHYIQTSISNELGNNTKAYDVADFLRERGYAIKYKGHDLFTLGIATTKSK